MYKTLYDPSNHRFYPITDNAETPKHYKQGIREYLLCEDCESKINLWETYFTQQSAKTIEFIGLSNSKIAIAAGLDYDKFKLFQLSIVWRAGISRHPDFLNVQLGPHTEIMRQMIYEANPGEPWEYGCFLIFTPSYADILSQMIITGNAKRFDGHRCYIFLLAGLTWIFVISRNTKYLHRDNRIFMDTDGSLPLIVEDVVSKDYFEKVFHKILQMRTARNLSSGINNP